MNHFCPIWDGRMKLSQMGFLRIEKGKTAYESTR